MSIREQLNKIETLLESHQADIDNLSALMDHPGWKVLEDSLKNQIRFRTKEAVEDQGVGLDGMIEAAKKMSEVSGLRLAVAMPQIMIDECRDEASNLSDQYADLTEELDSED